ncbi:MAG: CoA transferase [Gammaproteobacteria bacterium]|nr:CoA transferase [Gammaproteobacteria bacterium]
MTNEAQTAEPFRGVNVVEFGQFVAVPFCAQLLAEGGAHIIKIEALEGDPTRRLQQWAPGETRTFISRNRGKHSLPLSLREPGAKPVIAALLEWADVALMNFRPGLAGQFGLDAETLMERFPRLIIGTVTAFGSKGPDAAHAGMDIVVQARSGLMAANGRIVDGRPAPGDPVSADYMCAMSMAFGVASALLRRERTGKGGTVDTSLMQAAMTLANNQLIRSEGHDAQAHRAVVDELRERREAGVSYAEQRDAMPGTRTMPLVKVYFRTYETADAVIAIACGSHSLREKFAAAMGFDDPALETISSKDWGDHYDRLRDQVEAAMRSKSGAEWTKVLNDAGVPVSSVKFPVEMFEDPQAQANDMFHILEHPTVGPVKVLSPPVRLDGEGFKSGAATAPLGSETQSILENLGFSPEEVDALASANVTHRGE